MADVHQSSLPREAYEPGYAPRCGAGSPGKGVAREYLNGHGNTSLDYLTGFDREPLCI